MVNRCFFVSQSFTEVVRRVAKRTSLRGTKQSVTYFVEDCFTLFSNDARLQKKCCFTEFHGGCSQSFSFSKINYSLFVNKQKSEPKS